MSVSPADGLVTSDPAFAIEVAPGDWDPATLIVLVDGLVLAPPYADGPHVVEARVWDLAWNAATAMHTVTVDTGTPRVEVSVPAAITTSEFEVRVTYSAGPGGLDIASLVIMLNGQDVTARFSDGVALLRAGEPPVQVENTLVASIKNRAGTEGTATARFQVDAAPPVVTFREANLTLATRTPILTIAYQDSGSGVALETLSVRLDGAPVTSQFMAGQASAAGEPGLLSVGEHAIEVSLADRIGNRAVAPVRLQGPARPGGGLRDRCHARRSLHCRVVQRPDRAGRYRLWR